MSTKQPNLINEINRSLATGFTTEDVTKHRHPLVRHEIFASAALAAADGSRHQETRPFTEQVCADSLTLCYSALQKLQEPGSPAGSKRLAIRSSLGLLDLAMPSDRDRFAFLQRHTSDIDGISIFDASKLEIDTAEGLSVVDFTDELSDELEALSGETVGCPVMGIVLDRYFERYVDTVFGAVDKL